MAKYSRIAYFMVVLALVINFVAERGEALSCADLGASTAQCGPYATGLASQPSDRCCASVKSLYGMAKTPQDRRLLCNCLKQASSSSVHGVQINNVAAIPKKCGVPVSISADPNFNCNSIN